VRLIAGYNGEDMALQNLRFMLTVAPDGARLHRHRAPGPVAAGPGRAGPAGRVGKLKYRETIAPGLAAAPEAFIGLLKGRNFGKQLVKLI
jgi:hypothetical protein